MIQVKDNKSLNEAILFLENQQKSELFLLKEHYEFTKDQLNPINIIKEKFHDAVSAPGIKGTMIKGAVGLVSGFFAKRFILGSGGGIISKIAGTALPAAVSGLLMNVPDSAKDTGISFIQKTLQKMKL